MNNTFHDLVLSLPMTDEVFDKLNTAANKTSLRQNKHLTRHQFASLWEKNLPAVESASLVDRDLDPDQVELVLSSERRGSVLLSLFRNKQLDRDQQEKCLKVATGSTFASTVMSSGNLDESVLKIAAAKLDGVPRLEWCASHLSDFDDDQLYDVIETVSSSGLAVRDMRSFNIVTAKLFAARPHLVGKFASSESIPAPLLTTLASSRFLTDLDWQKRTFSGASDEDTEFAALAFVANPVAHEEVVRSLSSHTSHKVQSAVSKRLSEKFVRVDVDYEQVSDDQTLSRILRRSLPNQYRSIGRPGDLVALAYNGNLEEKDAVKVFETLQGTPTEYCSADQLNAAVEHLAKRLSVPAPAPKVETGFWDRSYAPYRSYPTEPAFMLLPSARPWSKETIEALAACHAAELEKVAAMPLAQVVYASRPALHLYLVHAVGLDPRRWELLVNLSSSHHGTVSRLVMATVKLAR